MRYFPEYFSDYRENPDTVIRWTDRLQSLSGEWLGNIIIKRQIIGKTGHGL